MKFLAVVKTPSPDIYHACSTQKKFWEEKFALVNITSCGRSNIRKHRNINNGGKYIILDISHKLDYLYKREVTSSESNDYIRIPVKGLTTSLVFKTKSSNNKKRQGFPLLKLLIRISGIFSKRLKFTSSRLKS